TKLISLLPNHPSVVFIHGMWGGQWIWQNYMEYFFNAGYNIYSINLSGFKKRSAPSTIGKISFKDYLSEVEILLNNVSNPILIGHSSGALLACKVAEFIKIQALILLSPAPPKGILGPYSPRLLLTVIKNFFNAFMSLSFMPSKKDMILLGLHQFERSEQQKLLVKFSPESGKFAKQIGLFGIPILPSKIDCPTVVVSGGKDQTIHPGMAKKVARKLNSTYKQFENFGHLITLEDGWEETADFILNWIRKQKSEEKKNAKSE
ncbi:alpha/beta hydrolase, partial [candidate division KSB1 bacterium]|nr:alpha/beta hydrolase [candidate division KSB1 bacterium]